MATRNVPTSASRQAEKRRGFLFLLVAAVFFAIGYSQMNEGGIIPLIVSLVWVISLLTGVFYLVKGFFGKRQP